MPVKVDVPMTDEKALVKLWQSRTPDEETFVSRLHALAKEQHSKEFDFWQTQELTGYGAELSVKRLMVLAKIGYNLAKIKEYENTIEALVMVLEDTERELE